MTTKDYEDLITRAGYDPQKIDVDILEQEINKARFSEIDKRRATRALNRSKRTSNRDRAARTHQLCNIGGAALMFFPKLIDFTQEELESWFSYICYDTSAKKEYEGFLAFKKTE